MTSLLGFGYNQKVSEAKFLQALNMPIADIERGFRKINVTKRNALLRVLGAEDIEPATLIRKLKQLRNIEDTLVTAATEEESDDSSSKSDDGEFTVASGGASGDASGGDVSEAETVVGDSAGASKRAEPVKTWKDIITKLKKGANVRIKASNKEGTLTQGGGWYNVTDSEGKEIFPKKAQWDEIKDLLEVEAE